LQQNLGHKHKHFSYGAITYEAKSSKLPTIKIENGKRQIGINFMAEVLVQQLSRIRNFTRKIFK
jgi:hypothetical protein